MTGNYRETKEMVDLYLTRQCEELSENINRGIVKY